MSKITRRKLLGEQLAGANADWIRKPCLPPIDPTATTRTPPVDPTAAPGSPSINPTTTPRTPSVDPNASLSLRSRFKPGASKYCCGNGRNGPFPQAPEKQAPFVPLPFLFGSFRFKRWFIIHDDSGDNFYDSSVVGSVNVEKCMLLISHFPPSFEAVNDTLTGNERSSPPFLPLTFPEVSIQAQP